MMGRKILNATLLVGFLLFWACRSSLLEACPQIQTSLGKAERSLPPCHQSQSKQDSEHKDCSCPLAYQEVWEKAYSPLESTKHNEHNVLQFIDNSDLSRFVLLRNAPSSRKIRSFPSSNSQFLQTIRLLI
ncbi:hypothetical protein [Leptospira ryugenii]|uniref:hypothetical protein n=1 Tax=Leptospira ryugenii TaxID=1917863 RepID=UPI000D58DE7B|nr:hypothetical protein [Leptospira ryugenii]